MVFEKFAKHPLILSGRLSPQNLKDLGITSEEDYFVVNQVSHALPLGMPSQRIDNFDLTKEFFLIPKSILFQGLNENQVMLQEKGVDKKQEDLCLDMILASAHTGNPAQINIYDPRSKSFSQRSLDFAQLNLYKTKEEKIKVFEEITGHRYNSQGRKVPEKLSSFLKKE